MVRRGRRSRAESQFSDQAETLARRLRSQREETGLTQEQLAARAGLAVATVRKIETGTVVEPGYFTVLALVRALGVRHDDLFSWPDSGWLIQAE